MPVIENFYDLIPKFQILPVFLIHLILNKFFRWMGFFVWLYFSRKQRMGHFPPSLPIFTEISENVPLSPALQFHFAYSI